MTKRWRLRKRDVGIKLLTNKSGTTYLPLLVDDGNSVLQLYIIEETGKEDIGNADQTVILLFVKERVRSAEI